MASTTNQIPTSQNEAWGFFGTINHHGDAAIAWPIAINTISDATQLPAETVATFLDSRHGRHFADDVANELATGKVIADAIEAATARWMGWRISARTAHETGIPRGLPYLTGFALHAEIEADTTD
jgi:hypothetical protein